MGELAQTNRGDCKVIAVLNSYQRLDKVGNGASAKERAKRLGIKEAEGLLCRQTHFQPYWGKPAVRNEWRGQGKRKLMADLGTRSTDRKSGDRKLPAFNWARPCSTRPPYPLLVAASPR